jgi:murein DD-endopeptidase MepM/ murein hydrolase activator NlpD
MASDFMSKFGIGGQSGNKVRLVADLRGEIEKLNTVLEKTVGLSEKIARNLRKASGKTGGTGDVMGGMNLPPTGPAAGGPAGDLTSLGFQGAGAGKLQPMTSTGFIGTPPQSAGSRLWDNFKQNIGQLGLTVGAGAVQGVDTEALIMNEVTRRRFGFYAGQPGTAAGANAMSTLMNRGTFMSAMDAAGAVSAGASMGLMPGMKNYNTVLGSMATISNLTPGVSGEQAAGAVAGLNQARNVNMLRMLGINVRDQQGLMRGFEEIANDLWNSLNRQKTGMGKITAEDLALSLQPGNSLDMLLNQYFGNDPVLRQSVVAALYQKAGGGGFSKESLKKSGANPELTQSFGERRAREYGAIENFTDAAAVGVTQSNNLIRDVAGTFENASGLFKSAVDVFVTAVTGSQNFLGAFGGAPGTMLAGVANFVPNLLRGVFGGAGAGGDGLKSSVRIRGGRRIGGEGTKGTTASPLKGQLTTPADGEFGNFNKSFRKREHRGVDFVADIGDPVFAVQDGEVIASGESGELGNRIRIKHGNGYKTVYAHLDSTAVSRGDTVSAGDLIGYAGNTGASTGPHLHLAVENQSGGVVDPSTILSGISSSSSSGDTGDSAKQSKSLWSQTTSAGSLWSEAPSMESASGSGGDGVGPANMASSVNYGGVNVTINIPTGTALNEEKLAREIKKVLADEEQLRMAVTR